MQQALPAVFGTEYTSGSAKSASRVNKYVVASAAMLCAGAIAVNPVTPTTAMPEVQQHAVQLAAWVNPVLEDPLALWTKTFTDSFSQIGAIGNSIAANPFPILNQISDNQFSHLKVLLGAKATAGQRRGTGIIGSAEAFGRSVTNLPVRIQAVNDFLENGQFTEALVEINTWVLVLGENLFFPLLPVLAIPGNMFDAVGRVYDSLITRGNIAGIAKGVLSPALSVAFALANVVDQVFRSVQAGNIEEAFTAVINAPAIAVGAFFNGYQPMFGYNEAGEPILSTEFFPGLFSVGGTIDSLFVKLPQTIAAALAPPVVVPTVASVPSTAATLVTLDVSPAADAEAVAPVTDEVTPEATVTEAEVAAEVPAEAEAEVEVEGDVAVEEDAATENEVAPATESDVAVEEEAAAEDEDTAETDSGSGASEEGATNEDSDSESDATSDGDAGSDESATDSSDSGNDSDSASE